MNTKTLLTGVAATLAVVGLTVSAHAQTNTYTGANNESWGTAGNWTGGVPTSAQDVIHDNGVTARILSGTDAVAGTVTIGGASGSTSLEVRPITAATTASLTVAGNLTLSPGAGASRLLMQFDSALTLNGGNGEIVRGAGAGLATLLVQDNWSGTLGLATATVDDLNMAGAGNGTLTITSAQTYNVAGTFRLANNNTGADAVLNLNGGTLNLGDTTPHGTSTGRLQFNSGSGADNNATFNLNNGGTLIAKDIHRLNTGASAVLNFNDGTIATRDDADLVFRSTATGGTMDIALAETGTHTFEAAEGRLISVRTTALLKDKTGEAGTLTKTGEGTLRIDSASTYTGATTINAGSLVLGAAGSIGSSSVLNVASGATLNVTNVTGGFVVNTNQTLRGGGTVLGNTRVNGALQPGNSAGLLTFSNNLTLGSNAITTMEIYGTGARGTAFDAIDVGGMLTYGGALTLSLSNTFAAGSYSFDLFDFGSTSGSFGTITLAGEYSGSLTTNSLGVWGLTSGNETWTFTEGDGLLALEVVPEPSTYALLFLAAAGLGAHVVRRRRSNNR